MKNKKLVKIAAYILLVIGSIGIVNFPSTYSYFKNEEQTALVFKSKLYNLYDEYSMKLEDATIDIAKFRFSFKPSVAASINEVDEYEIVIPDSCLFDKIVTTGETAAVNNSTHSHIIKFNKNSNRTSDNYIYISCSVGTNSDTVKFESRINGTMVQDNKKFAYRKYVYEEKYSDYLAIVNQVVESESTITGNDLYNNFISLMRKYGQEVGFEAEVIRYVQSVYPNETALKNTKKSLLGLSVEYDNAINECKIKILDNFVGYARTYYSSIFSSNNIISNLYFSTTSPGTLDQAFKNYLKLYIYQDKYADDVYNFVYNHQRISSVIFNGNEIDGLQFVEKQGKNSYVRLNKKHLLSMGISFKEKTPCVVSDTSDNMLTYLGNAFLNTQDYTGLSIDTMISIYDRTDIQTSMTKNNTTNTAKSFTDYYIQKNGSNYLLITISSDATDIPVYTKMEFKSITVPEGMTVTFNNNSLPLKVRITYTNSDSIKQVISSINSQFGTSTTGSKDISVNSPYSVEYTINKKNRVF